MNDDYLWDRSGKPDPEVQRLERALGPLAHQGEPLQWPEIEQQPVHAALPKRTRWGHRIARIPSPAWAAAASLFVGLGIWFWLAQRGAADWEVAQLAGAPRIGDGPIARTGRLAVGDWLETDAVSRARVTVGKIGLVEVEPNTRVRLLGTRPRDHRLALARGTLNAYILAPPRRFFVETPSAMAVDLGCAYTLEVDAVGGSLVTVLAGWVSFELDGRESFIPAGARCATHPGRAPGTPYFADASAAFKNALVELDLAAPESPEQARALPRVLEEARREDALTLWHLLPRMRGAGRAQVYERIAALVPPPRGVTREGVLRGDRRMLDLWWGELGLGTAEWWRLWQDSWPQARSRG